MEQESPQWLFVTCSVSTTFTQTTQVLFSESSFLWHWWVKIHMFFLALENTLVYLKVNDSSDHRNPHSSLIFPHFTQCIVPPSHSQLPRYHSTHPDFIPHLQFGFNASLECLVCPQAHPNSPSTHTINNASTCLDLCLWFSTAKWQAWHWFIQTYLDKV